MTVDDEATGTGDHRLGSGAGGQGGRTAGGGHGGGEGEPPAKRPRSASPGAVHPIFAQAGNKKEAVTTAKFRSLGLFKTGGGVAQGPSLEESARAELKTL